MQPEFIAKVQRCIAKQVFQILKMIGFIIYLFFLIKSVLCLRLRELYPWLLYIEILRKENNQIHEAL